jgi:hypothetical protein
VRVVDGDDHVVAVVIAALEPARRTALGADAGGRAGQVEVERVRDPHRDDDVLEVVRAHEPGPKRHVALRGPEHGIDAVGAHGHAPRRDVGFARTSRDPGADAHERRPHTGRDRNTERVVDVDHGRPRRAAGEQQRLRLGVLLHRSVKIEVVLREVRESSDAKADCTYAARSEGDR